MNPHTSSLPAKISADYRPLYRTPATLPLPIVPDILKMLPTSLATLAHEIRNPLTTVNLATEMLTSTIKDDESLLYLDIIKRSSIQINRLLNELLKYQETEEKPTRRCSISMLLNEVLEMAADRIALKKVTIRRNYAVKDDQFTLSRSCMKMALTNIIINALDAMPANGGVLKLSTYSIDSKYFIRIEDNGCGISKANLKNIFTPYYTNKAGGMGLGLSTCHEILTANQMEVTVSSKEGKGTCFMLGLDQLSN